MLKNWSMSPQFEWNLLLQVSFHLSKKASVIHRLMTLPWRSVWCLSLTQLGHQWSEQLLLLVQSEPQRVRHVSWGALHVLRCSDGFVQWAVQEIPPTRRRCKLPRRFLTSDSCYCVVVVARRWTGWWWAQPEVGVNTKKCDISSIWGRKYFLDGLMEMNLQDRKWTQVLERWRWSCRCGCAAFNCFSWLVVCVCVTVCESGTVWERQAPQMIILVLFTAHWSGNCGAEQDLGNVMDHSACVEAKIMKFVVF